MITIENECVGCSSPSYPCIGDSCPNRNIEVVRCNTCKDDLYTYIDGENEDEHFCIECAIDKLYEKEKAIKYLSSDEDIKADFVEFIFTKDELFDLAIKHAQDKLKAFGDDEILRFVSENKDDYLRTVTKIKTIRDL